MSAELSKPLFAGVAGLALALALALATGAVACGGSADGDPTQSVESGGQVASASPEERVDGFQIFPHNSLFPPITLPPPPDGGLVLPPFTLPPPPDGGLFAFPPIALPGLPPITLPVLPPITLGPPPDGGIIFPPLPGFPGH